MPSHRRKILRPEELESCIESRWQGFGCRCVAVVASMIRGQELPMQVLVNLPCKTAEPVSLLAALWKQERKKCWKERGGRNKDWKQWRNQKGYTVEQLSTAAWGPPVPEQVGVPGGTVAHVLTITTTAPHSSVLLSGSWSSLEWS